MLKFKSIGKILEGHLRVAGQDSSTSPLKQGSVPGQQVQQYLQPGVSAWTAGYKHCVTGSLYKGQRRMVLHREPMEEYQWEQ